jgi:serine/threonine protein kinase
VGVRYALPYVTFSAFMLTCSLGIMIYELTTRSTPFEHDNAAIVYQNIIESKELLHKKFSSLVFDDNSKDIIQKLINDNPNRRLGMLRNGMPLCIFHYHSLTHSLRNRYNRYLAPFFFSWN